LDEQRLDYVRAREGDAKARPPTQEIRQSLSQARVNPVLGTGYRRGLRQGTSTGCELAGACEGRQDEGKGYQVHLGKCGIQGKTLRQAESGGIGRRRSVRTRCHLAKASEVDDQHMGCCGLHMTLDLVMCAVWMAANPSENRCPVSPLGQVRRGAWEEREAREAQHERETRAEREAREGREEQRALKSGENNRNERHDSNER